MYEDDEEAVIGRFVIKQGGHPVGRADDRARAREMAKDRKRLRPNEYVSVHDLVNGDDEPID